MVYTRTYVEPPILVAARAGNEAEVRRLLAAGTPVDETNEYDEEDDNCFGKPYTKTYKTRTETALCGALSNGHVGVVRLLVEAGAALGQFGRSINDDTRTPVRIARRNTRGEPRVRPRESARSRMERERMQQGADLVLGPHFARVRAAAEERWAAASAAQVAAGAPRLFDLAARAALLRAARERLRVAEAAHAAGIAKEYSHDPAKGGVDYALCELLDKAQRAVLAAVSESMHRGVKAAWARTLRSRPRQHPPTPTDVSTFRELGEMHAYGEGTPVDAAAAATWLLRGLRCLAEEDLAACSSCCAAVAAGLPPPGRCLESACMELAAARAALTPLLPGPEAAVALEAIRAQCAAAHASPLAALERRRSAAEARATEVCQERRKRAREAAEAKARAEREAAEAKRRRLQELWEEHRAGEVLRCRRFDGVRPPRPDRGAGRCTNWSCAGQNYCTYWHDEGSAGADLPPRCRWFDSAGGCTKGDRCWFNHLRRPGDWLLDVGGHSSDSEPEQQQQQQQQLRGSDSREQRSGEWVLDFDDDSDLSLYDSESDSEPAVGQQVAAAAAAPQPSPPAVDLSAWLKQLQAPHSAGDASTSRVAPSPVEAPAAAALPAGRRPQRRAAAAAGAASASATRAAPPPAAAPAADAVRAIAPAAQWPPAMKAWVERAMVVEGIMSGEAARQAYQQSMREVIVKAQQTGEVWTRGWASYPLPALPPAEPRAGTQAAAAAAASTPAQPLRRSARLREKEAQHRRVGA